MRAIHSELISVVIQGPVFRSKNNGNNTDLLQEAINSIRTHLPKAEIILSTWTSQNVEGLNNVKIIQSEEIESFIDCNGDLNNVNKQILSTITGLRATTRPYALKFRADLHLNDSSIAQIGLFENESVQKFFSEPITITNFFVRDPVAIPFLFHVSDIVMFGKRDDLLDFWDQPYIQASELLMTAPLRKILGNFRGYTRMRHLPEQSLMLGWLKKHGLKIHLPHASYTKPSLFLQSETILLQNFNIINHEKSGINFPARFIKSLYSGRTVYTEKNANEIKLILGTFKHKMRYGHVFLNKYILAWFKPIYCLCVASVLLSLLSQKFEKKLRYYYRRWKKSKNRCG